MRRLSLAIACLLIGFGAGWFMRGEPLTDNLAAAPSEALGEGGIMSAPSTDGRAPEQAAPPYHQPKGHQRLYSISVWGTARKPANHPA